MANDLQEQTPPAPLAMQPRLIRMRDAPFYVGVDRNRFNAEVRPHLTEIPIGSQGIAFDRVELDAWVDDYIQRNGRPRAVRRKLWDVSERPAFTKGPGSGTSTNASKGTDAFARAVERATSQKQSDS